MSNEYCRFVGCNKKRSISRGDYYKNFYIQMDLCYEHDDVWHDIVNKENEKKDGHVL